MKWRTKFCGVLIGTLLSSYAYAENEFNWRQLIGDSGPNSLYLGMWTLHLMPGSQEEDNADNYLVSLVYKGIFVATFMDSFDHRDYSLGFQRYWLQKPMDNDFEFYLGYRLGLVYGYGDHLIDLNGLTPVLPFAQLISSVTWKNFGIELSYTGIVVSTELYVKF